MSTPYFHPASGRDIRYYIKRGGIPPGRMWFEETRIERVLLEDSMSSEPAITEMVVITEWTDPLFRRLTCSDIQAQAYSNTSDILLANITVGDPRAIINQVRSQRMPSPQ